MPNSLPEFALLVGIILHLVPVAAAYYRQRVGLAWVGTALAALSTSAFLGVLWQVSRLGNDPDALRWVHLLASLGVPILLSGFFFSAVVGRKNAGESLRNMGGSFGAILVIGVAALVFVKESSFLSSYEWKAGSGRILLGPLGKAYLGYLLVGVVLVGRNLESTYRLARRVAQQRLQPLLLGAFGVLGFGVYVFTAGLLRGEVELDNLVATVVPLSVANLLIGFGILRGSLVDTMVPVSRNVIYSSLTAVVAALYALAVGTSAQLAEITGWSPGQVVTVSFVFIVILAGAGFFISGHFQRRLRRFIDLNFYVNRYDYRLQWSRVSQTLDPSQGEAGVLRSAQTLFQDVFLAEEVSIALKEPGSPWLRPVIGKGTGDEEAVLSESSPLCRRLQEERRALLLDQNISLSDSLPASRELESWRQKSACLIVAPLLIGDELVGLVGLERARHEDRFSYEDLDLLSNMAAQVATMLRSVQLGHDLAEAREVELLSQWSNMILHDLKNYLSPLRLIVQNMRVYVGNPEFQKDAVEDLDSVANRMESLIKRLSDLRQGKLWTGEVVDLNAIVEESLEGLKLSHRRSLEVKTELSADLRVQGDLMMLRSVVENLVNNAVDAMEGKGTLTVRSEIMNEAGNGNDRFVLRVSDEGPGMEPDFVRERLFRPFATTKRTGWGLGLYQSRSIVEAHGGEIHVESSPGEGTEFRIVLPGTASQAPRPDFKIAASIPQAGRRKPWTTNPKR